MNKYLVKWKVYKNKSKNKNAPTEKISTYCAFIRETEISYPFIDPIFASYVTLCIYHLYTILSLELFFLRRVYKSLFKKKC